MFVTSDVPYCGSPPVPGELWRNWNLDPILIVVLLAIAGLYAWGTAGHPRALPIERWRRGCFYSGWLVLAAMLVSPLCNLSVALFSARVGQHLALTLVAAPLLMLGRPQTALRAVFPALATLGQWTRRIVPTGGLAAASSTFAIFMWMWHTPAPYEATLASGTIYWLMHLTLIGSALALWHALFENVSAWRFGGVIAALATSIQMGLLGAIITLASRPLFDSHSTTTWPWGLTQLEDQQLGGLIMWVPGGAVFLIASMIILAELLRHMEEGTATP